MQAGGVAGRLPLPRNNFDGTIGVGHLEIRSKIISAYMARTLLRSRELLAAGILSLLVGVVVLSAATRQPWQQVPSGAWHTWAAGHMTAPEGPEIQKLPVELASAPALAPFQPPLETASYLPPEKPCVHGLTIVAQIRNFRSPPFPGSSPASL